MNNPALLLAHANQQVQNRFPGAVVGRIWDGAVLVRLADARTSVGSLTDVCGVVGEIQSGSPRVDVVAEVA